jgi:hypothetical protein
LHNFAKSFDRNGIGAKFQLKIYYKAAGFITCLSAFLKNNSCQKMKTNTILSCLPRIVIATQNIMV